MQIKKVVVYANQTGEKCFSVIAVNDAGGLIVGNTGYVPNDLAPTALDFVVSKLGSTQDHYSLRSPADLPKANKVTS